MILKINGVVTEFYGGSLDYEDVIEERSTCTFVVVDEDNTRSYAKGHPVQLFDSLGMLIFAGVVETAVKKALSSADGPYHHVIYCADNHYFVDKRIVAKAYQERLAGDIVKDIITTILAAEGITWRASPASIEDGPVVQEAVFNYATASDCLNSLAEKAGFWWKVDQHKILHFKARATNIAPWALTVDDTLGLPAVENGNPKYRNRQYIRGGMDVTDVQVQTFRGDGRNQSFALGYRLARVPEITVNGVAQTAGIKVIEAGRQWYWSRGDAIIVQDPTAVPLTTADILSVSYRGEYSIVVMTHHEEEISGRQLVEGSGSGYVDAVEDEPQITGRAAAFQSGARKLQKYATMGRRIRFKTARSGLETGQLLTVQLPEFALNTREMLIESISTADYQNRVWYQVTAVEGPITGTWAKMFHAMATRGQAFIIRENIREDQVLVTLARTSEAVDWLETISAPKINACLVPSTTLYPADSLRPC